MHFTLATVWLGATLILKVNAVGVVTDVHQFTGQVFDYLIVGGESSSQRNGTSTHCQLGGTAGLAVASRLSENSKVTVGVLEAGQDLVDDPLVFTPSGYIILITFPLH